MTPEPKMLHETAQLSPWRPDTDRHNLRVLGKALEELGEGVSALARCIIQGIDESEPVTGKPNRQWASEELADVAATCGKVVEHFKLDMAFIAERVDRKKAHLDAWEDLIREPDDDAEVCGICDVGLKDDDQCFIDIELGIVHAACCGPEREGYVNLTTGEPLGPDEPLPTPFRFGDLPQPRAPAAEGQ